MTKKAQETMRRKMDNMKKSLAKKKSNAGKAGSFLMYSAETQGSLFACSVGEGYLGEEQMQVGGIDVRLPAGVGASVYGLYKALNGDPTAGHAMAIGNGVVGSFLASMGVKAGQKLRKKWSKKGDSDKEKSSETTKAPTQQHAPQTSKQAPEPLPEPRVRGDLPLREILISEPSVPPDIPEPRTAGSSRFLRARTR